MNIFGKRLAELRQKKGLSQYEFAEKIGFSRGQVGNYEQGRREPDYETLNKIANFFKVSVDYLLGRGDIYDIGWALKKERERQGISLKELAKYLNIQEDLLSQYELDEIPIPSDIAEDIVSYLGMSYPAFLVKYDMWDEEIPEAFDGDVDAYLKFEEAKFKDAMNNQPDTLAAHHDGEDWTEEELEEIERFKEFVRMKRKLREKQEE